MITRKIGIIGGGQLAMLMIASLRKMDPNVFIIILDPEKNCPARQATNEIIIAQFSDLDSIKKLFNQVDIVTYEFENILIKNLDKSILLSPKCIQTFFPLMISQNRIYEKLFFQNNGLKTSNFFIINNASDFKILLDSIKLPSILKTTTLGYDGKGQFLIKSLKNSRNDEVKNIINKTQCILEEFIVFTKEVSVIGIYNNGEVQICSINENIHKNGILQQTRVCQNILANTKKALVQKYIDIASKFPKKGILTIEFFLTEKEEIIANEMAPRVHNSGHHTTRSMKYSQFDYLASLLLDKPIVENTFIDDFVMINVLGQYYLNAINLLSSLVKDKTWEFIDYNKKEAKPNRKMAHFNIKSTNQKLLQQVLEIVGN